MCVLVASKQWLLMSVQFLQVEEFFYPVDGGESVPLQVQMGQVYGGVHRVVQLRYGIILEVQSLQVSTVMQIFLMKREFFRDKQ